MNLLRKLKSKLNISFRLRENAIIDKIEEREINKLVKIINDSLEVDYNLYVANIYRQKDYSVWEYNNSEYINLIIKKSDNIIFIQCRDDNRHIDIYDINMFKNEVDKFIRKNQIFQNYNIKLKYAISSFLFKESAYRYIKNNLKWIEYDIIKINYYL